MSGAERLRALYPREKASAHKALAFRFSDTPEINVKGANHATDGEVVTSALQNRFRTDSTRPKPKPDEWAALLRTVNP